MIEKMGKGKGLDFTCFEKYHCRCCAKSRFQERRVEEERPIRKLYLYFIRTVIVTYTRVVTNGKRGSEESTVNKLDVAQGGKKKATMIPKCLD